MNKRFITAVVVLIAAGAAAGVLMLNRQQPGPSQREPTPLPPTARQFMAIVPEDISEDQSQEIMGIFRRFYDQAARGEVRPEDQIDVGKRLVNYLEADSIESRELDRFMARVSFYTLRTQPGYDASAIHPLLEEADSTR